MVNLREHSKEIDKDFISYYFANYMLSEWGVEVGYIILPKWYVDFRKTLCDWQNLQDCCTLCIDSHKPKTMIVKSYAILASNSNPCSPFIPLYSGPSYYPVCTYSGVGDFSKDFSVDMFK